MRKKGRNAYENAADHLQNCTIAYHMGAYAYRYCRKVAHHFFGCDNEHHCIGLFSARHLHDHLPTIAILRTMEAIFSGMAILSLRITAHFGIPGGSSRNCERRAESHLTT